jgi:hypothetical protein
MVAGFEINGLSLASFGVNQSGIGSKVSGIVGAVCGMSG